MNSPTLDAVQTVELRLQSTIENWKRKLLDVSKRNRSLNFKPLRVSTISFVDASPNAVFSKLWINGSNMRFAVAESLSGSDGEPANDISEESQQIDDQTLSGQQIEMLFNSNLSEPLSNPDLYTKSKSEARRADNSLQTNLDDDKLDRSLRRLSEQTQLALEEQGVNILFLALGMLHYKESADSSEIFQAPLVLLPVELSRKSSRSGYVMTASGDEPMVNPALIEYLRRSYGLALPELPDAASMGEEYDLHDLLEEVRAAIKNKKEWDVTEDIHLALFSFQKFMMYKDLEQNLLSIAAHRLIRQLILRTGPQYDGLPADIQSLDLDHSLSPEHTFQVVDADSSQLRAIAAVAKNLDLVMEGPPGTGKSQTITNLIALALASGRSVLFVAEKNAALKVVYQRLVNAGLGDFCLELHSTKANKRAVIHELARSLDASLQTPPVSAAAAQKLPIVRERLTNYVKDLHKPFSELSLSPYQVIGRYDAVVNAPRVKYLGPVDNVTQEQLDQTMRELSELAEVSTLVGDPRSHPWRDTSRPYYSEDDFETVEDTCKKLLVELENIDLLGARLAEQLGLPQLASRKGLQDFVTVSEVIARSPGAPENVLESNSWDSAPPSEAADLLRLGRDLQKRVQAMNSVFNASVYETEHLDDVKYIEEKLTGLGSLIALLDSKYRQIRKRWMEYRLPSFRGSMRVQAECLKRVDQISADRRQLTEKELQAEQYFGDKWQGENSDWDSLDKYVAWVVEFRKTYLKHDLDQRVFRCAARAAPDFSDIKRLEEAVKSVDELLSHLGEFIGWTENYLNDTEYADIRSRITTLVERLKEAHQWTAFKAVHDQAAKSLAGEMIKLAMDGQVSFHDLIPAFQRSFYQKWLDTVIQARKPLLEFNTLLHEQRVTEFQDLDRSVLAENKNRLIRKVRDDVQKRLQESAAIQSMPFLRREIARQRGLSPLRRTLKMAGPAIRAIKPCFMMSPLTVAQHLDSSQPGFDLVIFDEASQLPPEDAIGAICRGKQLVVVGDPKQLPPTNFFGVMNGQVSTSVGEDGVPVYEDGESILEELMAAGLATSRLKWHYRSAHESLIHFSNVSFYDSDLYTFPSVEFANDELGISFEYIENGLYEGKGLNLIEARRVVDAVEKHVRTFPQLSLGVGTFNLRQQIAIQDEIENRRRLNLELDAFCGQDRDEPFFVKNLENIQGDERDVIFISVTYGKASDGRLRYNFGPINGENGWRRLNVLASRARRRMKVFSSIRAEDISLVNLTSVGARLLRNFLAYAESKQIDQAEISQAADTESPFEHEVYTELIRHGISVVPQVGVAGYRIDFGVLDDDVPGRYLCGIECDGVTYHASETARDRDRLRQQVLEGRGWLIYRIWSTDWFKDRAGQVSRILELIQQARAKAKTKSTLPSTYHGNHGASFNRIWEALDESEQSFVESRPAESVSNGLNLNGYVRPKPSNYKFAKSIPFQGYNIVDMPIDRLAQAVVAVVKTEGPIHVDNIVDRVVELWGTKAGKRIVQHIKEACRFAIRKKLVTNKGVFLFTSTDKITVRSRNGLKFCPEHIAHEEYREAVLLVLQTGYAFPRKKLADEVRTILGFGRTTATLEDLIGQAIDDLLANHVAGDASAGIALRR